MRLTRVVVDLLMYALSSMDCAKEPLSPCLPSILPFSFFVLLLSYHLELCVLK